MTFARMIDSTLLQSVRLKDKGFSLEKHEQILPPPPSPLGQELLTMQLLRSGQKNSPPTQKRSRVLT